mmetsp:Transcript_13487/g.35986  ORF Transcript_13487/g.35986 Transcript_13487/m.35986 type:complete len:229 (-) Transcript_13487:298-984(-)
MSDETTTALTRCVTLHSAHPSPLEQHQQHPCIISQSLTWELRDSILKVMRFQRGQGSENAISSFFFPSPTYTYPHVELRGTVYAAKPGHKRLRRTVRSCAGMYFAFSEPASCCEAERPERSSQDVSARDSSCARPVNMLLIMGMPSLGSGTIAPAGIIAIAPSISFTMKATRTSSVMETSSSSSFSGGSSPSGTSVLMLYWNCGSPFRLTLVGILRQASTMGDSGSGI